MTGLLRLLSADPAGRHLLRAALAAAAVGCGALALLLTTTGSCP